MFRSESGDEDVGSPPHSLGSLVLEAATRARRGVRLQLASTAIRARAPHDLHGAADLLVAFVPGAAVRENESIQARPGLEQPLGALGRANGDSARPPRPGQRDRAVGEDSGRRPPWGAMNVAPAGCHDKEVEAWRSIRRPTDISRPRSPRGGRPAPATTRIASSFPAIRRVEQGLRQQPLRHPLVRLGRPSR